MRLTKIAHRTKSDTSSGSIGHRLRSDGFVGTLVGRSRVVSLELRRLVLLLRSSDLRRSTESLWDC